jgi:hypothetical protein
MKAHAGRQGKSDRTTIPCKMIGREAPASARACARHQIVEIVASDVNTRDIALLCCFFFHWYSQIEVLFVYHSVLVVLGALLRV